jgi:Icc-related predicted phosphoesterase
MRVLEHFPEPVSVLDYLNAGPGARTEVRGLPITRARVAGLPTALDAVIFTADLQGRELVPGKGSRGYEGPRLVGEVVAAHVAQLGEAGLLPPAERTGVILAGDLWAEPGSDTRGGLGDVAAVWRAFARYFRWVVGVLGNHDRIAGGPGAGCHLLDGKVVSLDGLRIGGVGGIVGNPNKPNRRGPEEFTRLMSRALMQSPDVMVLHCGPDTDDGLRGDPHVREALEAYAPPLAVFGHCHWNGPLATLETGTQLCNVDGRLVVATR